MEELCGYVLLLPTEGQCPDLQNIRRKIRKTYESIDVSKFAPVEEKQPGRQVRYNEFMVKADINFGNVQNNQILKENILQRFCHENVMSGVGESWLHLDIFQMNELVHQNSPRLSSFSFGSIVHMNTFVQHYSSAWSADDDSCRITQPTISFKHYFRKIKIKFNVTDRKAHVKNLESHQLHVLELDYNMIQRILIEIEQPHSARKTSGIKVLKLYLVISGAPLIKIRHSPDQCKWENDEISTKNSHEKEFDVDDPPAVNGNLVDDFKEKQNDSKNHPHSWKTKKSNFTDKHFQKKSDKNKDYSNENNDSQYCSPALVDEKMKYCRASEFGKEKTSAFCSSKVFGLCRVICLELLSREDHENELWETLTQFLSCCAESQTYFSSMKLVEQRHEFENPSINCDFDCFYALKTVTSSSYSVADELNIKYKLKDVNSKLNKYAKENPNALEKTLFDIQENIEKGNVMRFVNALNFLYEKYSNENLESRKSIPDNMVLLRRALMTPTRMVYLPPIAHMKSYLLRSTDPQFALRITIRDDNCDQLTFTVTGKKPCNTNFLCSAIGKKLKKGVKLGKRDYQFFGASSSQLREHGCIFYAADNEGNTAESLRNSLGDLFKIRNVAKYMARMGQSLSQALYNVELPREHVEGPVPDITVKYVRDSVLKETGEHIFSDGIGQMSLEVAEMCYKKMGLQEGDYKPCALQIRYAGCKGMVLLNPKLEGKKLILRKSMWKYDSNIESLEILKSSFLQTAYLNRPFICILEQMGIDKKVFFELQSNQLCDIVRSLYSSKDAVQLLHEECVLRLPFQSIDKCGIDLSSEPFFRPMVLARYTSSIGVLKTKARIKLPFSEARTMFGVMDETGTLEYGEVFVQYTKDYMDGKPVKETKILEGTILITKNPCMHPGDVRKFQAVNVEGLKHVKDCVVFPQKGPRPHPFEMAGSDLDGDEYCVVWYKPLIFDRENHPPMDYSNDKPPTEKDNIEVEDMVDFLCDYIRDDCVGLIASAHLAWADSISIFDSKCMTLAKKYSVTLDFAKSGQPERLDGNERVRMYPDFMEKFREKDCYLSNKVLGYLFRNCKRIEIISSALNLEVPVTVDDNFVYGGWEEYKTAAEYSRLEYINLFSTPTRLFRLTNEGEIMSGAIKKLEKSFTGKNMDKNITKMLESVIPFVMKKMKHNFYQEFLKHRLAKEITNGCDSKEKAITLLQNYVFQIFKQVSNGAVFNNNELLDAMLKKASAWYVVAYQREDKGSSFYLGLPWVVPELMGILHARRTHQKLELVDKIDQFLSFKGRLGEPPSTDVLLASKEIMAKWIGHMNTYVTAQINSLKSIRDYVQLQMNTVVKSIDVLQLKRPAEVILKCLLSLADSYAGMTVETDGKFWLRKEVGIWAVITLTTLSSSGMLWDTQSKDEEESPYFLSLSCLTKEYREEIRFPLDIGKRRENEDGTMERSKFGECMLQNTTEIASLFKRHSKVRELKIDFQDERKPFQKKKKDQKYNNGSKKPNFKNEKGRNFKDGKKGQKRSGEKKDQKDKKKVDDSKWYTMLSVYGKPFCLEALKDTVVQPDFHIKIMKAVEDDCCIM